jgi:cell division protein FtsW
MLISFILLILVLIFSKKVYGAKRWLFIGQPSELAKFSLILFWADYLDRRKSRLQYFWKGLIPPLFITIVYIGSIIVEPDIGIPIIIVSVIFILLYVSGVKIRHLILISSISLIVFFLCILYKPYRIQRIFAFLDPWKYKEGVGYQIIQSLLSLGSGGFIGKGLGQSELKKFYLPGQHTDFIFSIIGEELGIIGTLFIVLVFTYFLYTGFKIAKDAPDLFSKLLALGLTLSIVLQAYFNIAVCCSCLPPKGISLPFISYGGSSLVITLISIGILANISLKSRKTIKRKRI